MIELKDHSDRDEEESSDEDILLELDQTEIEVYKKVDHHFTSTQVISEQTQKPNTIFACSFNNCDKTFTKLGNIRNHIIAHLNIKPFVCMKCKGCFTQKGNLVKHLIQKHSVRVCLGKNK